MYIIINNNMFFDLLKNIKFKQKYHCVMKNELITFGKTVAYVMVAMFLVNAIERKYLKSKTEVPLDSVK